MSRAPRGLLPPLLHSLLCAVSVALLLSLLLCVLPLLPCVLPLLLCVLPRPAPRPRAERRLCFRAAPPQPTPKRARSGVRLPRTVPVSPLNKLKQEVACDARSRRAVGLPALPRVDARRLPARGPAAPDLRLCDEVDLLFAAALFDSCCCVEGAESTVTLGAFECELCIGAVRFSLVGLVGGGSIALLDAVAVHPDWRRSGTGSRLVAAARGSASPPLLLVQSPEPSVAFFARIGESGPRARALLLSAVSAGATDVVAGTVPRVV